MDEADLPSAARDDEPGVLGNLPTTRPQHRSARRRGTVPPAAAPTTTTTALASATTTAAVTATTDPRRRSRTAAEAVMPPAGGPAPELVAVPDVPAPPAAPRSGWATPEPTGTPAALPPLVALADGAVRTGAQLLRGVLRRLPGG